MPDARIPSNPNSFQFSLLQLLIHEKRFEAGPKNQHQSSGRTTPGWWVGGLILHRVVPKVSLRLCRWLQCRGAFGAMDEQGAARAALESAGCPRSKGRGGRWCKRQAVLRCLFSRDGVTRTELVEIHKLSHVQFEHHNVSSKTRRHDMQIDHES